MNTQISEKIGSRQTIKAMLVVTCITELYSMMQETKGDFANGILFYISDHLRLEVLLSYFILFISAYLLGRKAGKEILVFNKNNIKVGLKYSLITTAIISVYMLIITFFNNENIFSLLKPSLIILILMAIIWLWVVRQIRIKGLK